MSEYNSDCTLDFGPAVPSLTWGLLENRIKDLHFPEWSAYKSQTSEAWPSPEWELIENATFTTCHLESLLFNSGSNIFSCSKTSISFFSYSKWSLPYGQTCWALDSWPCWGDLLESLVITLSTHLSFLTWHGVLSWCLLPRQPLQSLLDLNAPFNTFFFTSLWIFFCLDHCVVSIFCIVI